MTWLAPTSSSPSGHAALPGRPFRDSLSPTAWAHRVLYECRPDVGVVTGSTSFRPDLRSVVETRSVGEGSWVAGWWNCGLFVDAAQSSRWLEKPHRIDAALACGSRSAKTLTGRHAKRSGA